MNKRLLPTCLLLLSFTLNLQGQDARTVPAQQDPDVVPITTNLVQVDVVVTKDRKQVTDLKPEDFEILEDGRPQKITNFSFVSTDPAAANKAAPSSTTKDESAPSEFPKPLLPQEVKRTIAIVVDDLGLSFESMANLRTLRKFLSENVR